MPTPSSRFPCLILQFRDVHQTFFAAMAKSQSDNCSAWRQALEATAPVQQRFPSPGERTRLPYFDSLWRRFFSRLPTRKLSKVAPSVLPLTKQCSGSFTMDSVASQLRRELDGFVLHGIQFEKTGKIRTLPTSPTFRGHFWTVATLHGTC